MDEIEKMFLVIDGCATLKELSKVCSEFARFKLEKDGNISLTHGHSVGVKFPNLKSAKNFAYNLYLQTYADM